MKRTRLLPSQRLRGFTLTELLTVITIVAVLAAVAVPSFRSLLLNQRLASAASAMVSALNLARSEAIKRSSRVSVLPARAAWGTGWDVKVDAIDEPLLGFPGLEDGIAVDATTGNGFSGKVTYDPNGFARDALGRFGAGCLAFKAATQRRVAVIVSDTGRPRTCDPDRSGDCGSNECGAASPSSAPSSARGP
ncbi:type IV fimbrial biogenesis protein FimT [Variovorax sp. 770b2]|nr:type IV fimbrial biogenesis protein FimT [Variovorax sp. 770b2]